MSAAGDPGIEAVLARLRLQVTRRLDGLLHGDHAGLLPGPGSEAGEARPYAPGDDVRRMDWPVTARTTVPHVRETIADRELETRIAVDLTASLDFGTALRTKRELAVAATAAVAHLAGRGGNRVGAVLDVGGPLVRLPARAGRPGAEALLRRVAAAVPAGPGDLAALVDALHRPARRRGLAVLVADLLAPPAEWARPLRLVGTRHDLLVVEILDPRELELPDVGDLTVVDPETGRRHEVPTGSARLRRRYAEAAAAHRTAVAAAIRAAGGGHLRLRTDSDWLRDLVGYVAGRRHALARGVAR
ncbi:hypothetical protein GCM10010123_09030 [Pilimelia anulata]|uniref:DUF58 domain-containing protein n=1 Tax=Pilimelia anulata TaxID=53371 RepID=A0A8J3B854_9ACTN|nr:DUF58 domain-containing protein [Pilimelia anulata]GGJ81412.1 hypothetical protein GCM10010123_09030 [Pilimelia anulata]